MYDEVVSSYDQEIKFVTGFAGSGKSTELAKRWTETTLVLVPTHDSAKVLMAKGLKSVFTIHSVLGLVPTLNMNFRAGQKLQVLKRVGEVDLSAMTDIFIDEFSLINTDIIDMLLELLPTHCNVTVFGDPYQLPPVDGNPIDPNEYADEIHELTIQHRAEAPEVVETFMRIVDYIKNPSPNKSLRLHPDIEHGNLDSFEPTTDRAVAFTNERVIAMNLEIADNLGYEPEIGVGEPVIINNSIAGQLVEGMSELRVYPKCISKGAWKDMDELVDTSFKCSADINKFRIDISEYPLAQVEIDGVIATMAVDFEHYRNNKIMVEEIEKWQQMVRNGNNLDDNVNLAQWCKENRGARYVRERGQAWAAKINHDNYVFDVRRPFATTVHRAQGKEFDTVYIAQADLKRSIRGGYYLTYARLMYVALSRAKKRVVIV